MARPHRHERPAWFEQRGPIFQRAMDQFVAQLAGKPGVSRILLIGSVARGEPRPADLDLAVIVANLKEAVPHVSLASRRLSQITHLADVFVFDTAETYVGRICQHHRYGVEHFPLHRHHAALRARQSRQMLHLDARHSQQRPDIVAHDLFGQMPFSTSRAAYFRHF